jgi:hypothetical protein
MVNLLYFVLVREVEAQLVVLVVSEFWAVLQVQVCVHIKCMARRVWMVNLDRGWIWSVFPELTV